MGTVKRVGKGKIIVDWLVNYAIVLLRLRVVREHSYSATFKQNMGLNVRELGAKGSADFEWNPALGRPIPSAGAGYKSVTVVDQSFQTAAGLPKSMNTRKRYNSLNHRNLSGGTGPVSNRACRSKTLKSNLLKYRLKRDLVPEVTCCIPDQMLNGAVAEAEALAWSTPYPLLFLPGLVEEKILGVGRWASRQREILERQNAPVADCLAIVE
jgi:hypothetical protein